MARCMQCQRELTGDEIGLHKKMINRGAAEFLCITCLAGVYHCEEELLRKKIEQFLKDLAQEIARDKGFTQYWLRVHERGTPVHD